MVFSSWTVFIISFLKAQKGVKMDTVKCKYHFRKYKVTQGHPFLVVVIKETTDENGKTLLSGFNLTHSVTYVLSRPNKFIRIDNPNPTDDADCFLNTDMVKDKPIGMFSKPIQNWELSEDDIKEIDTILLEKYGIK